MSRLYPTGQLEGEALGASSEPLFEPQQVGMNKPDKTGEPSMEEILASIRQIIADEPSSEASEPVIEANPLVPSQTPKPTEARGPLADRLSGMLKNGSLPPTDPLGSKRPLSFDQDLADMFDDEEPANGRSVAAPKPDIRVPAALSHPMSARPFVAPLVESTPTDRADAEIPVAEVAKEEPAKPAPLADGAAALPPHFAPSEPAASTPPVGGSETKPAEAAPRATFGFPPLRKASFYPPQPKAPFKPAPSIPAAIGSVPMPFASPAPEAPAEAAPNPASSDTQDVLKALGGLASGVSAPSGAASRGAAAPFPASASESPTPRFSDDAPSSQNDAIVAPETPYSAFAPSAAPAASLPGHGAAPLEPPFGAVPRAYTATPAQPIDMVPEPSVTHPSVEETPAERRAYPDPFAQTVHAGSGHAAQPRFGAEPGLSSDAAHQALDALAMGLAASAAAPTAPFEPVSPAVPLTPVFEASEAEGRAAPTSSMLPATIASQGSMPVNRTLEDAVADMLRPMLQQWVAENMPRIIERALRTEVAQSVQPRNKPPGT